MCVALPIDWNEIAKSHTVDCMRDRGTVSRPHPLRTAPSASSREQGERRSCVRGRGLSTGRGIERQQTATVRLAEQERIEGGSAHRVVSQRQGQQVN